VARAGGAYYMLAVVALASGQLSMSGATFGDVRAGGAVAAILGGTIGATAACVALFWLIFGLLGPAVGPAIGKGLFYALAGVLWPVAWVLDAVLGFLLADLGGLPRVNLTDVSLVPAAAEAGAEDEPGAISRGGVYVTRALLLIGSLGGIALVIALVTRLRRKSIAGTGDGSVGGMAGALGDDLRGLMGSLFRRQPKPEPGRGSTLARQLYVDVLRSANEQGMSRDPSETPTEMAPRLSGTLHTPVVDEITAAFLQSRYAGREPDAALVRDLERRWRELPSGG
jgi:hypothetical protein